MSRTLTLLAALLVVIAAFLLLRNKTTDHITTTPAATTTSTSTATPAINTLQDHAKFINWREFTFKPGHFKVLLPALPQHVSDTVLDPKTKEPRKYETFATAADNGAAFIVNAITYSSPFEAKAGEDYLKEAVNDMLARNKENKLNTMNETTFRGHPALDFSMNNGDLQIEGKILTHLETMYILSMINKKDAFNKSELDYFINSFELVDDANPANGNGMPANGNGKPANHIDVPTNKSAYR